jgi:hypothetical protein
MRTVVAILVCAALVAGGATLAIASGGGAGRGSPSHHQYKAKPACKPYSGKQSSKASSYTGRGHCPNHVSKRR